MFLRAAETAGAEGTYGLMLGDDAPDSRVFMMTGAEQASSVCEVPRTFRTGIQ